MKCAFDFQKKPTKLSCFAFKENSIQFMTNLSVYNHNQPTRMKYFLIHPYPLEI